MVTIYPIFVMYFNFIEHCFVIFLYFMSHIKVEFWPSNQVCNIKSLRIWPSLNFHKLMFYYFEEVWMSYQTTKYKYHPSNIILCIYKLSNTFYTYILIKSWIIFAKLLTLSLIYVTATCSTNRNINTEYLCIICPI